MTCRHGSEFPHFCYECMEEDNARLREEVERLQEVIVSAAVVLGVDAVDTADPHCLANAISLRSRPSDPERVEKVALAAAEYLTDHQRVIIRDLARAILAAADVEVTP